MHKCAAEDFCLRECCRYYNQDTGECIYEVFQRLRKKQHEEERDRRRVTLVTAETKG
jgi:hypothetical protein